VTLQTALGLGDPYHVGIAVHDLDDAMARLGSTLGLEPWATLEAEVPAIYRGAETLTGIRSAFARSGSLLVELVQPTGGNFTAQTFLDERGEGIYHLGYWVEDMAATLERVDAAGIGVDWRFPVDGDAFAVYLDAKQTLGIHVELVSPNMKPIVDKALADAR
jgi:catechol 2,3-dioxygenase-like lactoylglutathione lyase family enzyme